MGVITHRGINYPNSGSKVQNISEDDYAALVQAGTIDPNTVYFRYELEDFGYEVQDDGTATDLIDGKVPTGRTIENVLNSKLTTIEKIYDGGSSGTSLPASNLALTKAFTDFSGILIEWVVGANRRQCFIRPTDFGVYYYDSFGTYQSNTWYFAKIIFQFPANQNNKKITFGSPDVTGWSDSPKLLSIWGIY